MIALIVIRFGHNCVIFAKDATFWFYYWLSSSIEWFRHLWWTFSRMIYTDNVIIPLMMVGNLLTLLPTSFLTQCCLIYRPLAAECLAIVNSCDTMPMHMTNAFLISAECNNIEWNVMDVWKWVNAPTIMIGVVNYCMRQIGRHFMCVFWVLVANLLFTFEWVKCIREWEWTHHSSFGNYDFSIGYAKTFKIAPVDRNGINFKLK